MVDPRGAPGNPRLTARIVLTTIEMHRLVLRRPADVTAERLACEITQLVRAYLGVAR